MRISRTVNRRLPSKGELRRNGFVIEDPNTGKIIHIRLRRGRDRDNIRVCIDADDQVVIIPDEKAGDGGLTFVEGD